MSSVERANATQLANIEKKTGKSLEELASIIRSSGLTRHSDIRDMLMEKFGLGYGDATQLTHHANKTNVESAVKEKGLTTDQVLDEIYAGPKASLRPIHDKLISVIVPMGEFEIAPKKGYVSLRRKRQFAMLGPATNTRFELGLNIKNMEPDDRLIAQTAGSMCNYIVRLTAADQVDEQVISWVRRAYEAAG